MIYGTCVYPVADYFLEKEGMGAAFAQRMRWLGVTSISWNIAREYHLLRAYVSEARADEVYSVGLGRVTEFLEKNQDFSIFLGIDVTGDRELNYAIIKRLMGASQKVLAVELHNEPTLEPWTDPAYYHHCLQQIRSFQDKATSIPPFCINWHSMSESDKLFYSGGRDIASVFNASKFISPHSYGIHHLRDYDFLSAHDLWVTEWSVFSAGRNKLIENRGIRKWEEIWSWILTWVQLLKFNRNKRIKGIYMHHATRSPFFKQSYLQEPLMAANVHRRFAK